MFEIPILDDATPRTLRDRALPAGLERLARDLATMGFLEPSDLRIGGGGVRCLIEKAFRRWWGEARLPASIPFPLQFTIVDPADANWLDGPRAGTAWLVASVGSSAQRIYLAGEGIDQVRKRHPSAAEHALAVLFEGLNSICYSVKGPEMKAFAEAYWWRGKRAGPMTRRKFGNRVPEFTWAPQRRRGALELLGSRSPLRRAVERIERDLGDARILRPNATRISGKRVGQVAAVVRWRHGDPAFRLLDDHWHQLGDRRGAGFQGAWPLAGRRAIRRMLERIVFTVRFADALSTLIEEAAYPAGRIPYYV